MVNLKINFSDVEIESSKYFLHENFCKRNFSRCKECNEVVEIMLIEEHNRQKHVDFPCNLCKKMFKKYALKDHAEVCPRRLKQCPYCELEVEDCEMSNHLKICGSHTEKCTFCNNIFLVRELNGHLKLCDKNPEKKRKVIDINKDASNSEKKNNLGGYVGVESNPNFDDFDFETEELIRKLQEEEDRRMAEEL